MRGFTPVEVYFYRFLAAYIVLFLFTFKNIRSKSWRDELSFLLCGVCCGSLYFITENYALTLTTAGNVSLLVSISPIFTTILVAVMFRQKIQTGVIVGSVVSFIRPGCIIFSHGGSLEFRPAGDLLALSAALSWAVYTVAIKRVLPLYSGFFVTRKLFFYGVLTALPLLLMQQGASHVGSLWNFSEPSILMNFLFLVALLFTHGLCSLERSNAHIRACDFEQLFVSSAPCHNGGSLFPARGEHIYTWLCRLCTYYRRTCICRQMSRWTNNHKKVTLLCLCL